LIANHGDPLKLDLTLDRIFKIAKHCRAVLLLDEADVFTERRTSSHDSHNRLVTIFLRKLEYYEGILFMTTNRVTDFDEAILSRIHLKIKYEDLSQESRREIWARFLSKAITPKGPCHVSEREVKTLESKDLNGREVSLLRNIVDFRSSDNQIHNIIMVAQALAIIDGTRVSYKYLELAAKSNDKFVKEFNNSDRVEGMYT
jgi:SpoVK/Ycf46/Vps4 family AAA+-type ATPase